ncbi:MAG: hypothetical protein Q9204_005583 [Flavoplaca sp. TL-2023a]
MSLSAVSNLSLFSLPISIHEIWNTSHYTAAKDTPLLSPSLEYQLRAPSRSREPLPWCQDEESSSTSSKTLTSRGSYGLSDSEELDIPKPERKIVFRGMLNTLLSRQELDIPKPRQKIVFHGTNESGMSTLIKQMQIFYAPESINATTLEDVRFGLWFNLITAFIITLEEIADIDDTFESKEAEKLFLQRRDISINDFLRVRTMSRDNTEISFETTHYDYHIINVHGAHSGRKHWVHTWEGADYLFFVASLAGYNTTLTKDTTGNQMIESLKLFESLLAIREVKTLSIVLLLNKLDVFKQQIQENPLWDYFPDFVGREKDSEAALSYIVAKFKAVISVYDKREMKVYFTDATNIEACQATLRDIEDTVMS